MGIDWVVFFTWASIFLLNLLLWIYLIKAGVALFVLAAIIIAIFVIIKIERRNDGEY